MLATFTVYPVVDIQYCMNMENMMKAASLSFQAAVLLAVLGMIWGLVMAISGDHSTMPAHAHLILLGWVSLFLFGIFYQLHPAIDHSRTALIQVSIWILGTLTLTLGVALIHSGHAFGEPFAAIGSLTVLAGMLVFGWLVIRREQGISAHAMASHAD